MQRVNLITNFTVCMVYRRIRAARHGTAAPLQPPPVASMLQKLCAMLHRILWTSPFCVHRKTAPTSPESVRQAKVCVICTMCRRRRVGEFATPRRRVRNSKLLRGEMRFGGMRCYAVNTHFNNNHGEQPRYVLHLHMHVGVMV